jgi:hypothetical protein
MASTRLVVPLDVVRRKVLGSGGDDVFVVDAHELDEVDGGELRHDVDRVGRAGVSVAHISSRCSFWYSTVFDPS